MGCIFKSKAGHGFANLEGCIGHNPYHGLNSQSRFNFLMGNPGDSRYQYLGRREGAG